MLLLLLLLLLWTVVVVDDDDVSPHELPCFSVLILTQRGQSGRCLFPAVPVVSHQFEESSSGSRAVVLLSSGGADLIRKTIPMESPQRA